MENESDRKECSFGSFLQKFDIFGMNIALTFNKKQEFKTSVGGLFSIGLHLIMLLIVYSLISRIRNRTNINVYESVVDREQTYGQETLYPFENNKFMIGLVPHTYTDEES